MQPDEINDPRTKQAIEVLIAVAVLGVFHLFCLAIGFVDRGFVFGGYLVLSCMILPVMSVASVVFLIKKRSWHGGQILLFLVASAIMSFLQLTFCISCW